MTRESTMQPFAKGDIFIACTLLNVPDDDHAGEGRIWQYDKDMNFKGELWTEGGNHFVGGLEFDPNGPLWAFNDFAVIHVDPKTGRQLPLSDKFLPRCYRSASFDQDGNVYLGEHMKAKKRPDNPIASRTTTKFPVIPGEGVLGFGYVYKYDKDWNLVKVFHTECAPDMTQFKGVTHSSLHPSGEFIIYATETGKRLMRYDVINDRQMPDLVTYPGEDIMDRVWVIAVKYLPDGRLLITRGDFMEMLDEDGNVLKSYPLETYGWSDIEICHDGEHCLVSNIWEGTVVKVNVESGDIVATIDTGFKAPNRCVAGVAEYPG
ncbi:MAG: hypothetical protein JSV45_10715 [Chromatiales bacterium]|nr:MAG: hypothetical protein JSV45_10715 [Chromatiales bacterium]